MAKNVEFDILARDRASQTFDRVGRAAESSSRTIGGIGKAVKFGATAAVSGVAALAAGVGASISKAMDYDKTMRMVGATLGTTGAQQKALGALALKMGADTVFSAKDASDAMLELAKGGMTAAQIQAGALSSTLTLASAGGLDLGNAATYMSNALNTFGLSAQQSGSVAAALAGGANASSASVESLGLALQQVGPGARTAGLSLQTTTGILAAFDNAGIKGSDAGTTLKTMLQRLVPQTKQAAGAMHKLGLDFTDAKGHFLPMRDVAEQLRKKMSGLSDEQRSAALTTIFGSDATRAATVLMNLGKAGVDKYTKATSDQAAAQRLANTQMQGASGAWEQFKGSIETLAITVGQKLLPAFTHIVTWLTKVTNSFAEKAGPAIQRFIGWVSGQLWPALQRGYQIILPGIRQALSILKGGVEGNGMSWKKFGEIITSKVIPLLSVMIRTWLPMVATNVRIIIEVVKAVWRVFETWMNVVRTVIAFILRRFADLTGMWSNVLRALAKVPGFGWAKSAADKLDRASGRANALASSIERIPNNKNVNVTLTLHEQMVRVSTAGNPHGNIPKNARGTRNFPGGLSWVGEQGPELVYLPKGSDVYSNGESMALARGGTGGGGSSAGGDTFIVTVPPGTTRDQAMALLTEFKRIKRQSGVNLGLA